MTPSDIIADLISFFPKSKNRLGVKAVQLLQEILELQELGSIGTCDEAHCQDFLNGQIVSFTFDSYVLF